jgi:hypothetical protein
MAVAQNPAVAGRVHRVRLQAKVGMLLRGEQLVVDVDSLTREHLWDRLYDCRVADIQGESQASASRLQVGSVERAITQSDCIAALDLFCRLPSREGRSFNYLSDTGGNDP